MRAKLHERLAAGFGPGGVHTLFGLGLLSSLKGLALVLMAEAVARGVVGVIEADAAAWQFAIVLGIAAGLLRAATAWATESFATRAALGAKEALRHELAERVLTGSDARSGASTAIATVGLDELDNYFRVVLPAIVMTATVPLLVGLRILSVDWVSALIVVLTIPLVPVFMVLVGGHTRERADAASASLERLSDHLVELARGLPVLVGLGRVAEQSKALRSISAENRTKTMETLRTAFLSALVLELIATISVAVVAVFVGVRLVDDQLSLTVGLIALVLAPECFAPFRELGAAFHSSENGLTALRRARTIIDAPRAREHRQSAGAFRVVNLTIAYEGRALPAVNELNFRATPGTITALDGPSGSGKSSVLEVLAGNREPSGGSVWGIDVSRVAWVPQHPHTVADTVLDELRLYSSDEKAIKSVLLDLGLTAVAEADPRQVSPGELRRIAVARGLLRVEAGATLLLLDEPTAHLDPASAARVEAAIAELRGRPVTVLVASHEAGIAALADQVVAVGASGGTRAVEARVDPLTVDGEVDADALDAPRTTRATLASLLEFVRPSLGTLVGAIALGVGASLFAISLTAISGWLIVRASEHPPIMFLLVAIVGVRFFGIGRAALRYAERLATHRAVLGSVIELRVALWNGLGARALGSRALANGGVALDYLVAASDRVRDLVPRVVLPPAVALGTSLAALIAVGLLHAPAVPVLLAGLAVGLIAAPIIAVIIDRSAANGIAEVQSRVVRAFAAMTGAASDLRANGVGQRMLARLDHIDAEAGALSRRSARALGIGNAVVVLACSVTAVAMLPIAAPAVVAGTLPIGIVAVLVLIPIGLVDSLIAFVDSVQQWPALSAALAKVRGVTAGVERADAAGASADRPLSDVTVLELRELGIRWPSSPTLAFSGATARVERGEWLVVEGPSGAGKSTLLAALLGYLPAAAGSWSLNGVDARELSPEQLRAAVTWCPQESHLFDSTIRANLLLGRAHDDQPTEQELVAVLRQVGLGPLFDSLDRGLDTRVGSAGESLSGGERQRLAVARTLLTRADVVLLDEPTAHLDAASAEQLITDLRTALADKIVVLVSHHDDERRDSDVSLRLGAREQVAAV
ncbi:thiol reductant ABC exporter subunit CydD [Salinibacterium sp. NSLL150]|uniref:thiol reductant ABC exporter subunit CydD n=1 Tax=unclassified Salinibacterium TaxID=2632331 RepID=UPI0018CE6C57|nr:MULTISPECIES: thiol reductant ABC exporter subunit CydD [unclassified Salinibacterium]MBH0097609.1 thiol reductant ABC exporter subunit CydD [Salinibacterium sp. NSLL35]MBH0100364.1 thiol reductant ABC exporter subunit CydD [Salinibacterium sp. NSLL150]MBH0103123.1 thiol reductant ABC exporter subunit CydD [Salinibacterium sp. NSLL16]MBH0105884.1 thiol reductant ABC exporter subunit CydD [Salinibacterium sp. NSLL17]